MSYIVCPNLGAEPHISDDADVVMEPLKEQNLPNPPLVETEVQSESDVEMWEPKREPPIYVEISSEDESGDWGCTMICMAMRLGLTSDEEDPEEDVEEVPIDVPRNSDSEKKKHTRTPALILGKMQMMRTLT